MRAAGVVVGLALVVLGGLLAPANASTVSPAQGAGTPRLEMTASVSPSPLVVGERAVYTVTVRNTGDADATDVTTTLPFTPDDALTVDSPLPTGCIASGQTVTCTEGTIPAGGSVTYDVPVTVLPSDSDGTNIALRATATAPGAQGASADLITQAYTKVDVEITKSGPAEVSPDGTIIYTITVKNNGPSDAVDVTWHDPTDGNLTTITSYPCGDTGLTVSCSVGTMAPGDVKTYQIKATVNHDVADDTVISNCATVYTGTSPETNPDNNVSCVDTTVNPGGGGTPESNVEIVKTAPATVEEGGTIDYSVTVTNHGPDPATDVVISDPIDVPFDSVESLPADCTLQDSTVTCVVDALAVDESRTFTYSVKLGPSVAAGTDVMNCAAVTSKNDKVVDDPDPSCVHTEVVAKPTAEVTVAKAGPATADAGGTITYTLTATNKGPDDATHVVVTDPTDTSLVTVTTVPDGCTIDGGTVTCDAGTLAPGESKDFTITAKVRDGVAAGTVIRNCDDVTSDTENPDPEGTHACVDTTVNQVTPVADVEVVKSGPATAHAGGLIEYTVRVTNHGPDEATGVVVKDPIDTSLVTVVALPDDCAQTGGTVTCQAGPLAVDETKTFTFTVRPAHDLAAGTEIDNCAQADSDGTELNPVPQPSCVQTVIEPRAAADLSVVKTGPPTVRRHGRVTYALTVTNNGPGDAKDVVVTDPIDPSLITITSLPAGCTASDGTVTCELGTLAAGDTRVLTITGRVNRGIDGVVIPNCAQVYSDTFDPHPANNESCVNTIVRPAPSRETHIEIRKSAPLTARPGDAIEYPVTVTNRGPHDAANVIVTDPVDQSLVTVTQVPAECVLNGGTITCFIRHLAVGERETLTFTVKVRDHVRPGTLVDNCADAVSIVTILRDGKDSACAQTLIVPTAAAHLAISKSAPQRVRPGGTIRYRLSVTNFGPGDARDVVIADPVNESLVTITSRPAECRLANGTITCALGTLAAGETRHLTFAARVRPGVKPRTVIGNCAAVYSTTRDADPALGDTQSCVNTLVVKKTPAPKPPAPKTRTADVTVVKEGPATVRAGGVIGYTIRVTSRGPDTATDVAVTDTINESQVTIAWLPAGCRPAHGTITCRVGTLHVGQVRTFRYAVMVRQGLRPGTRIENCARATSHHTALQRPGRMSCTVATVATTPFVPVTG